MEKFAYYDTGHEFPEEILIAAGFTPYKILGDVNVPTDPGDRYIHNYICPFSRACLTEGLAHSSEWAGIAFAHGCDTTNRQYDVWKYHVKTDFLYWMNVPANNNKTAHGFHVRELRRFITQLETQYNLQITAEKLRAAIKTSNQIKNKLRELASLRATKDIRNVEYHEIMRKAVQKDKEPFLKELDLTLKNWKGRGAFPRDKVPVLLTGSDITYGEAMETIERAGLRVVRDDMSLGERYFAERIPETGDPVEALVAYNSKIPQPPTRLPFTARLDYLYKCLKETPVKGIIYQTLKFCEPHELDQPYITGELKKTGHKLLSIEREFTPTIDQQLVSRMESFRELL